MAYTAYTQITPTSGAANTKGAYTQIAATTPYASSRIFLSCEFATAALRFFLVDLAVGAAGAETVVVANLAIDSNASFVVGAWIPLAVDVPAGSRLAVRCQSVTAASIITLGVLLESRAIGGLTAPATYGADLVNSRGTQIDPGGTASTKGAYTQITASTTAALATLLVCVTCNAQGASFTAGLRWLLDIATGAAGAETIVLPDLEVAANTIDRQVKPCVVVLPITIAAGTRIAVRCSCSANTATQRIVCVTLVGMQEPASGGAAPAAAAYVG